MSKLDEIEKQVARLREGSYGSSRRSREGQMKTPATIDDILAPVNLSEAEEAHLRDNIGALFAEIERLQALNGQLTADLVSINEKFPCGHRKDDWDDSYGGCALCPMREMAFDYDQLPHEVVECHDEIERLKAELGEIKAVPRDSVDIGHEKIARGLARLRRAGV